MEVSPGELRYLLFPGENPAPNWVRHYQESFRCWQAVWLATLQELDGAEKVFSDDFSRQSFIGAIFLKERCITLGLFHFTDFRLLSTRTDSYFRVWPDSAIKTLLRNGPRVLVGSNITVDPEFRGDLGNGLQLKHLILRLMVETLLDSDVDVMTGTMRRNRGMHTTAYEFGGSPIEAGIIHHGVEVDLVAFYRKNLLEPGALPLDPTTELLWENRIEYGFEQPFPLRRAG